MSRPYTVITGASSGIGEATALYFAQAGHQVCLIARRTERLEKIRDQLISLGVSAEAEPHLIVADLSEDQGIDLVINTLKGRKIDYLIHNAGTIHPITSLTEISRDDWRSHMRLNIEAPLFITQGLINELQDGRVIHISSGAAHKSMGGWGAYCVSKAALYRIWTNIKEELFEQGIAIGSVRPGVVDTEMQTEIRASTHPSFTQRSYFEALKNDELLISPKQVAHYLYVLCTQVPATEFIEKEWDIREHSIES